MRVDVDCNIHQVHLPLPVIYPTVTEVEENPGVTYADIGGCQDEIEELREDVETPLLRMRFACHDAVRYR
ncbi:unnamed protein product [Strongylus vulgaris]|uniref:Uncharacterized protein n=1 Tax=Strongylus vulgaris TaxID=40348 RepID=A0A3P7IH49_STRVU|nr:unnamed protein product [Strongylus vulgaris]